MEQQLTALYYKLEKHIAARPASSLLTWIVPGSANCSVMLYTLWMFQEKTA